MTGRKVVAMGADGRGEAAASLEAKGWTRRFTALGGRLSEMAAFYQALGYEVRLEPAEPTEGEEQARADACESCFAMTLARTIYTRRLGGTAGVEEQRG